MILNIEGESMSAIPTTTTPAPAKPDRISWPAYLGLGVAAAVLGVVTSIGVWLFNQAFNAIHNLTFNTISGWAIALIPMVGGIIVALIMKYGSKPDKLAAMAHVIDGVAEQGGRLHTRNGFVYVIAATVGIGVGAPVGADTPSAMIGGHLASWFGQRFHQRELFIRSLVVAGIGAGISATFFAQLAAIFFALEIVLGGFGGVFYVVPTVIAVAMSGFTTFLLNGAPTPYVVQAGTFQWDGTLLLFVGVAVLSTLAAIVYVNLLPLTKKWWTRVNVPYWAKPAIAGLVVGIVGLWLPEIFGTGLTQMKQIFSGTVFPITTLLALVIAKTILTPTSLGSGFAGGVIGPALAIGSALGYVYGALVAQLFPALAISPIAFAMVATAAMLAGTFHAPLFGAMMVLEMTNNYLFLVPILLAVGIAYALAQRFQPGSAYTFALPGAGVHLKPGTFTADRPQG
jgi:CIC family chloride channel protein